MKGLLLCALSCILALFLNPEKQGGQNVSPITGKKSRILFVYLIGEMPLVPGKTSRILFASFDWQNIFPSRAKLPHSVYLINI